MPAPDPQLPRRTGLFDAWFVPLDSEQRSLLQSGRFRLLALSTALLLLLGLNLLGTALPGSAALQPLRDSAAWLHVVEILLLLLLVRAIWRELLQPLLRLCNWAELMRGVNLDARVEFRAGSDFTELARDVNMLSGMIQNLSRDLNELFDKSLQSLCHNLNARAGIIRQLKGKNKKDIVASQGDINLTFLASADRFLSVDQPEDRTDLDRIYRVDRLASGTVLGTGDAAAGSGEQLLVLSILLRYRDDVLGAIHLFFADDDSFDLESYSELLVSIGQHLGSAVEKFRLHEEESELLVMQERTRLSHELHDSLAQTIASLRIQIRVIDETFHSNDEKSIWHQMERIEYTIDQANNQLRELIAHFRVPINEQGLIPSIEESIRQTQEEMGIPIYFQNEWPPQEFSEEIELNVLRIVQECLANIRKHSQAESVRILLSHRAGEFIVLIEDDGIGFEEASVVSMHGRHLGLNILRDRAREIGARLDIESEPDDGTRIHLQFSAAPVRRLQQSTV